MEKLKQRPDGRYRAVYKGKDFYGATPEEALKKRNDFRYKMEHGIDDIRPITVAEYAVEWLPNHRSGVGTGTYNQYASIMDKLIKLIGDYTVSAVNSDDVALVWKSFIGYSKSEIQKAGQLYRAMFDSAVDVGYARRNPFRSKSAKPPKGTSGSHRALEDWERELIHTTPHRMQVAAMTMLYAGLRRGEVLDLKYSDIRNNQIIVDSAVSFAESAPRVKGTKTESSDRTVPLFGPLKSFYADKKFGYIIPSAEGLQCTESAWDRCWESYITTIEEKMNGCEKRWYHRTKKFKQEYPAQWAQYEKLKKKNPEQAEEYRLMGWKSFTVRPHDLRHSFCEACITAGVDLKTVMKWMGHSDQRMIMEIYDHVMAKRETAAIKKMNNAWSNKGQKVKGGSVRAL